MGRMKSNTKLLVEKNDVRVKRISFLRDIYRFIRERKYVIYIGESYILSSHTVGKSWSDDSSQGLHAPYHNVLLERTPNSNSRKVDMKNWLSSHGIPCSDDMFKPQLY
jgi:hypothetical protein